MHKKESSCNLAVYINRSKHYDSFNITKQHTCDDYCSVLGTVSKQASPTTRKLLDLTVFIQYPVNLVKNVYSYQPLPSKLVLSTIFKL